VIEVGTLPRGVAFFDGNVWVANARDASVSRVDPSSEAEAAEVATGETPITLMVLGDSLWVSVIGEEQGVVEENALENIDPETNTVAASWPVPIFHNTAAGAGLLWAFDSQNSLQAIEPETGQIAGTIEVGGSVQTIAATDETVWGAQTSGRIWKVDIGEMAVVAEFDTNDLVPGRSRIAATPGGAALAYKETLVVVDDDTESFEVVPMPSLRNVNDLVMVEEALWLSGTVVSDSGTMGVLLAIDPTTGEVIDTYELGPEPAGVSVGAGSIWVGDQVVSRSALVQVPHSMITVWPSRRRS
jgi:outer membrane protein assembly factor BamB